MRTMISLIVMLPVLALAFPKEELMAFARDRHGDEGAQAAEFLTDHMPAGDKGSLTLEYVAEHLDLAFKARKEFRWASEVPIEIFLNDVLPYAVFDEPREPWRAGFFEKARPLVKDARSASEAAQALNRGFFNLINVHYHTGRARPNQSPSQSIASGKASCTGLAILLVNACRAVGIPARAVGTPLWASGSGNHTWVEIWDKGWHFTGADEYDAAGLNRAWFIGEAERATSDSPQHAIYATSWKRTGLAFPMVWNPRSQDVAAVDVTTRYAREQKPASEEALLAVRVWDRAGGKRLVANIRMVSQSGVWSVEGETRAGRADMNDMPKLRMPEGERGWMFVTVNGECRSRAFQSLPSGERIIDIPWNQLKASSPAMDALHEWLRSDVRDPESPQLQVALTPEDASMAVALLGNERLTEIGRERRDEMEASEIRIGDKSMRWLEKSFGNAPAGKRSLWISMHGGGGAPAAVNDSQWQNQIRLYQPAEGIYIAPRAPTDNWNLWHEAHIDPMFQRLIENHVAMRGIDPDRVYLMGYSAGGDGVWQLAPRMADRFAAAAMMAGHPNESSLLGLRNLPFAILVGADDAMHGRNTVAAAKIAEMMELQKADPGGYPHLARLYEGLGHWMNLKDAESVPWMAGFKRDSWPKKIVWFQDDVVHERFYWMKLRDMEGITAGWKRTASVDGQTIRIEGGKVPGMTLRLTDRLLDLDQPVKVVVDGTTVHEGRVERNAAIIWKSVLERADLPAAATAELPLP